MDIKSKAGPFTAIVILAAVILWMLAGNNGITTALADSESESASQSTETNEPAERSNQKKVRAIQLMPSQVSTQLELSGSTKAKETLHLQSSYSGTVTQVNVKKGDVVNAGDVIISIDDRSLKAQIEQARASVEEKKLNLEAAERLETQRFSSKVSLASARAELVASESQLKQLLVNLEYTQTRAPFSGIVNDLNVNVGQILSQGATIGELVAINPLTIYAQVPQSQIMSISEGMAVDVTVAGFETQGTVSLINRIADTNTRSVGIEVDIPNEDNRIPAGVSSFMSIKFSPTSAHSFSPALLTLDEMGQPAVKTLTPDQIVEITPVTILQTERDKVWVSGLPDLANVITVGQGFVKAGDQVIASYEQ